MNLDKYISDLLYHNDCVVVPDFGAFIAQRTTSNFQQDFSIFTPPSKQVVFNSSLVKNDGLLIQKVAQKENISFNSAQVEVNNAVQIWLKELASGHPIFLNKIGNLSTNNDGNLVFEPADTNFLLSTYGLESIKPTLVLQELSNQNNSTIWWKVASVLPILIGGYLYFAKPKPVSDFVNKQWSGFVTPLLNPDTKADQAIESPVKTINTIVKKNYQTVDNTVYDYQVISGAFRKIEEANEQEAKLKSLGYKYAKLTQKKGSYFYVAFKTFPSKEEALQFSKTLKTEFPETWVLSLKD